MKYYSCKSFSGVLIISDSFVRGVWNNWCLIVSLNIRRVIKSKNLKAASPVHKSIRVSLPEVANNWKRGRDGSVWLAPAMSSCLECPYLGSTQLHPLIPSHWADAVRTINLPGWVPCHVLTANPTPSPSTHSPPHITAKPHHQGWKSCQSYLLLWLRRPLGLIVIAYTPLMIVENTWRTVCRKLFIQHCGVSRPGFKQELLCVFSHPWLQVCYARDGFGRRRRSKTFFGSGTLTTKYPGAVSGTNSNKSFSKRTVVNSRGFCFFCNCLFQRNERHLQLMLCKWLSGQREKEWKNKKKQEHFSLHFASFEFSNYFNTKEKPLIKTLPRQ